MGDPLVETETESLRKPTGELYYKTSFYGQKRAGIRLEAAVVAGRGHEAEVFSALVPPMSTASRLPDPL